MLQNLGIVIPVYNDWDSLTILLTRLNEEARSTSTSIRVLAVNDGSTEPLSPESIQIISQLNHLAAVQILHLTLNLGHQRAIAVGLCYTLQAYSPDGILVMDSDGEDSPEAIQTLIAQIPANAEDYCVVARRGKRTERATFRAGYVLYKLAFRLITGTVIDFGNFSLISRGYAARLVMLPDLWNNLPAAILRSRIPLHSIHIDRGHRYAGTSKMNFISLLIHGFSGIAVYSDRIFVRLLLLTAALAIVTLFVVFVVLSLRLLFPNYATPGWATTVTFGMSILLFQAFFTTLSALLMQLNSRVQQQVVPSIDSKKYVSFLTTLVEQPSSRNHAVAAALQ